MNSNTTPRVARRMASPAVAPPGVPLPADDMHSSAFRYYTPPPKPLASSDRKRSKDAPPAALATDTVFHNIVTMTASHSGIGLSVTASMLAWTLAGRGLNCALVDADFVGGCLDLLLGVERESGLRFSQIDAPLGRLEGAALNHELLVWEDVRILPYDPWNARQPEWWEVQAAIRALAEANDVVIVDAGQGGLIETVPDLRRGVQVVAAELSVMGLARTKSHRSRLASWGCDTPTIVGIEPRGAPRGRGGVGIAEAEDYLTATVLGPIRPNVGLCGDVLEGLGIRSVVKGSRKAVTMLADAVEQAIRPPRAASKPSEEW
ncbi:cobyric acid synthase [Bifidobacterium miconisargentati]|uniref:cobyric acid synthase n=1 Tax=Bifidobacterium miconisargentati TaxID=2834437 RepID=UPI001BDBE43E|nr:cobyric acid synthase [Bifidobacterium miconisargentati]MBW3089923.1 cobyric acid synthase [Bifidobacterium miconisargentati]